MLPRELTRTCAKNRDEKFLERGQTYEFTGLSPEVAAGVSYGTAGAPSEGPPPPLSDGPLPDPLKSGPPPTELFSMFN